MKLQYKFNLVTMFLNNLCEALNVIHSNDSIVTNRKIFRFLLEKFNLKT